MQQLRYLALLTCLLVAINLDLSSAAVTGLPSLFSRLRPSTRNQPQPQQQQLQQTPQQTQQVSQQDQILLAASSMGPPAFNGYPHLRQDDLMRLSAMQMHQHQQQQQQQQHHQIPVQMGYFPNAINLEAAAAQYRPPMPIGLVRPPVPQDQVSPSSGMNLPLESYRESSPNELTIVAAGPEASDAPESAASVGDSGESGMLAARQQMRPLATSHSEVVDKIERHIGKEIEAGLSAGASAYQQPANPAPKEHQASATGGEEPEEHEGEQEHHHHHHHHEHHEPQVEKRQEEHHHKEPEEHKGHEHHHEHHEHHEGAPEAFEVHHKKGGKSFQYFHQGHHESR